ncbi:MAG: DUF4390 domain-containing protein [Steroidobacteraceae bacterium]
MSNTASVRRCPTLQLLRPGALLLVCFLATMVAPVALAQTRVEIRSASLALDEGVYELDAGMDLELPEDARKAIDAGLALRIDYDIRISRVRQYIPDAGIASLVQSFEVSYHALSQRYLLRNMNTGEQQDYGTLDAALERVEEVRGLPVIDAALVEEGPTYEVGVRAVLDMGTAPDALSWLLFWTDDWSTSSEWYSWTLRR